MRKCTPMKVYVIYLLIFAFSIRAAENLSIANSAATSQKEDTLVVSENQNDQKTVDLQVRLCDEIIPGIIEKLEDSSEKKANIEQYVMGQLDKGRFLMWSLIGFADTEDENGIYESRLSITEALSSFFESLRNAKSKQIWNDIDDDIKEIVRKFYLTAMENKIAQADFYKTCVKAIDDVQDCLRRNLPKLPANGLNRIRLERLIAKDSIKMSEHRFCKHGKLLTTDLTKSATIQQPKCSDPGQTKISKPHGLVATHLHTAQTPPVICAEPKLIQKTVLQEKPAKTGDEDNMIVHAAKENELNNQNEKEITAKTNPMRVSKITEKGPVRITQRPALTSDSKCCDNIISVCETAGDACCKVPCKWLQTACDACCDNCFDPCCKVFCKGCDMGCNACCKGCDVGCNACCKVLCKCCDLGCDACCNILGPDIEAGCEKCMTDCCSLFCRGCKKGCDICCCGECLCGDGGCDGCCDGDCDCDCDCDCS